jgi:acetyl-CoA C-acetyltransferase
VGKFGGSLAKIPATEFGAAVIKGVLERSGLNADLLGEVIMGQVLAAGVGQNPARQSVIKAGFPNGIPGLTINAVCGSGLKAVMLAAQAVATGDSEIVIAGGQENMSAAPHVLNGSRDGQRMGDWKMVDSMIVDGLWDVYNQYHMGITAENVAKKYGIDREAQDALALASQTKAAAAQDAGKFKDEIIPITIPQKKGDPVVFAPTSSSTEDQRRRPGGPAPGLRQGRQRDGRQCLGPERRRRRRGGDDAPRRPPRWASSRWRASPATPPPAWTRPTWAWARCPHRPRRCSAPAGTPRTSTCSKSTKPSRPRPARSTRKWAGTRQGQRQRRRHRHRPPDRCVRRRILVTLLHEMQRRDAKKGMASLCIGGGMGVALTLER